MTTLARLAFWVPSERKADFETAYSEKLVPLLSQYGLVEGSEADRPTVAGVFSRLFEVETPVQVDQKRAQLKQGSEWNAALQALAARINSSDAAGQLSYHFSLYQSSAVLGQEVAIRHIQGTWQTNSEIDALVIAEDPMGHLWFGTSGGLYRYDGQSWIVFTASDGLAPGAVWALCPDRSGQLWVGTEGGASRYDGTGFVTFTTADGLASNRIYSIIEDRSGTLWLGTDQGVSRYDGTGFVTYTTADGLAHNAVRCLWEDREGHLWFGFGLLEAWGRGLNRYDGREFATYTVADGLAGAVVSCMVEDRQGHLWFGSGVAGGGATAGVSRYDGRSFVAYTTADGLASDYVCCMLKDREGHLWLGTDQGVSRYDGTGFVTYTTADGLAHNTVRCLGEDREGHLWLGTMKGINRYDGRTWTILSAAEGEDSLTAASILRDRGGTLWFGIGTGIGRYDGHTWTTVPIEPLEEGQGNFRVWSLLQDRHGQRWFGTMGAGVWRYDGHTWSVFTTADGLVSNWVISCLEDRQGHLWFGTRDEQNPQEGWGVSRYDGHTWTTFTVADGKVPNRRNRAKALLQDRAGHMWVGSYGGVSRYDGHTWTAFTTANGLTSNCVEALLQDRAGHIWVGTEEGVNRYDGHTWTSFTPDQGLAGYWVTSIWEDPHGHLWFGTDRGISRYDGHYFQTLKASEGLADDFVWAISPDGEDAVWFVGNGISRYRLPAPVPPRVFLDAVIADRRYAGEKEVELTVPVGLVAFEFHAVSFKTRPYALLYRFRLQGVDPDWRTTHARRVEYEDLPVGTYSFELQAVDRDLVYSTPAQVEVHVVPDPQRESWKEALSTGGSTGEFVGDSPALRQVQIQLTEVATTELTVLITGETGTGKGLAARSLHTLSAQQSGPFIQVNCGAIPEGLVESELFGHEKGAFTGADRRQLGKVELAAGGTLFLDEIGDMPLIAQTKLLHFLEEHTFQRVGGKEMLKVDVRVIAATNRDLEQMVSAGEFREDLYFRLQGFPIRVPSLRQRREDIPLLARYFTERFARHLDRPNPDISPAALVRLQAYSWPGNVRELEHMVQRAVLRCKNDLIEEEDVSIQLDPEEEGVPEEGFLSLVEQEKRYIERALKATHWVIFGDQGAARLLDINPHTLRSRIKKYGLSPPA